MKRSLGIILASAVLATTASAGDPSARPVMRDATTHNELVTQLRTAERDDPMKKLPVVTTPDPALANPPKDLLSESDILCFGGLATLVPKRAIINLPKNLQDRLKYQPGAKIVGWLDFYAKNRGWITTQEVNRVQAEGNQALADETADQISKSSNLVVATLQGGPISLLPPKEPPPDKPAKPGDKSAKPNSPSAAATPTGKKQP